MKLRSEADLEDGLFSRWADLRQMGRFDRVLPGCTTRNWTGGDGESRGYVTLDYRVTRQLSLPGAWGQGRAGRADLVELYWSVRTRGGVQDMTWAPSLNAHAIELKNEPLDTRHVEQLYRYVLSLRAALHLGGIGQLISDNDVVSLNVRGLLLGPSISEPVGMLDALASYADVPISVARFDIDPVRGVTITQSGREEDFFHVGIFDSEELRALGASLIANDSMYRSAGIWTVNPDSPNGVA